MGRGWRWMWRRLTCRRSEAYKRARDRKQRANPRQADETFRRPLPGEVDEGGPAGPGLVHQAHALCHFTDIVDRSPYHRVYFQLESTLGSLHDGAQLTNSTTLLVCIHSDGSLCSQTPSCTRHGQCSPERAIIVTSTLQTCHVSLDLCLRVWHFHGWRTQASPFLISAVMQSCPAVTRPAPVAAMVVA